MAKDNEKNAQKRKTLSLKSHVDISSAKSSSSKTIEVEIKRKKQGLAVLTEKADKSNIDINNSSENTQTGSLTEKEFKARIEALQNAMKEEQHNLEEIEIEKIEISDIQEIDHEIIEKTNEKIIIEKSTKINDTIDDIKLKIENPIQFENEKKYTRQAPKKKDEFISSDPVIFRASDYQKKADPKAKADESKTTQKEPLNTEKLTITKPKNKETEESFTVKKKIKVATKERFVEKNKGFSTGKVSRVVLDRVLNNDTENRERSMASIKRARMKLKIVSKEEKEIAKVVRDVNIPDIITVGELANRMAVRSADVVKYLMSIGTLATINQTIDGDTAEVICTEFGHNPKRTSDSDIENELENIIDNPEDLTHRSPIVAVMGHVDHGKTTLLDSIRQENVANKEAGGITQHVAAYQIEAKNGKKITFIDTPGHAAFSNIRSRGAVLTDIIVLVVAADDGIKEQTIEVIQQARSQNVPLIVAINKIDKPNINVDKVKNELLGQEVILEDFGGDVLSVEISARDHINLDGLIDIILLQSEMLELKANENRSAVGTILESRVDKGRGVVSSVILQHGSIKNGDIFVAGASFGKVRAIYDDKGKKLISAGPSTPIEIVGFNSAPEPGDSLSVVDSEQKAREIAEYRENNAKSSSSKASMSLDQMMTGSNNPVKVLNILVKADVYGSLEAVSSYIESVQHPEISVKVIEKGIGIISESDINFANNTNAIVVGFNVNITSAAKSSAKSENVTVLHHSIIYHMVEEVKSIMASMLSPIIEENYIGNADVRKIFMISKFGTIAGCYVTDGLVKRNDSKIKVMRNGKCIFEGKMRSMRHEKDEIKEAKQSHECGILAEGFNDFIEGDQIECYEIVSKSRTLD